MTMTLLAWLAAAAFVQGGAEEAARLAARLTAKDHRQSFDAVSRLADLAAASRPEVEAVASKIPDELSFYREVLQEELRLRTSLGARYPSLKRRSFDFKEQSPLSAFTQITAQYSEKLELNFLRRGAGGPTFSLELKDVPFMEAIEEVGRGSKAGIFLNGAQLAVNPMQPSVGSFAYRNFLALVATATRSRRIEFGAGETRSLQFWVQLVSDSEGGLLRVSKPRLTEAVDGDGRPIAELPEPVPAEEPEKEGPKAVAVPVLYAGPAHSQVQLSLSLPKSDTVARLRGWYDVLVAGEASSFEVTDLSKPSKKSDAHFEIEVEKTAKEKLHTLTVRVTPKAGVEAFLKMPGEARGVWAATGDQPLYLQGKIVEGRVDYSMSYPLGDPESPNLDLKSVVLRFHRAPLERRIPFEFRDLGFK